MVTLPKWNSLTEPHGWPHLKAKIVEQYIDAIDDLSAYDVIMDRVSDEDKATYAKPIARLSRKLYKAIGNALVDGTPAHDLMQSSKAGPDAIDPGEGLKLIALFDGTFGTSLNQRHGRRTVQQILMDIMQYEQGENIPAVYVSGLAALIAELPAADKLTDSMTVCIAAAGLHDRYTDTKKDYIKGSLTTLEKFKDKLQQDHDLLLEIGVHTMDVSKAHLGSSSDASSQRSKPAKMQRDPSKTCAHCGAIGHDKSNCLKRAMPSADAKKLVADRLAERKQKQDQKKKKKQGPSEDSSHLAAQQFVQFSAFIGDCDEPTILDCAFAGAASTKRNVVDFTADFPHIHQYVRTMSDHVIHNQKDFYLAVADSGTNKHLVDQDNEFVTCLTNLKKATGKVAGIGAHVVNYTGVGERNGQMYTVADGLKCFLYSLIQAGQKGILGITDWDSTTGENLSFILNKATGTAYPLVQLKPGGLLYVPLPKTLDAATAFLAKMTQPANPSAPAHSDLAPQQGVAPPKHSKKPAQHFEEDISSPPQGVVPVPDNRLPAERASYRDIVAAGRACAAPTDFTFNVNDILCDDEPCTCAYFEKVLHDAVNRASSALDAEPDAAYISDIIQTLSKRDQNFLMHCRLSHLSKEGILQLKKEGTPGIVYHPQLKELCSACFEARQKREPIIKRDPHSCRNPDCEFGTDLHFDVVYATSPDIQGHRYQLTMVDEKTAAPQVALTRTRGDVISHAIIAMCEAIRIKSGRAPQSFTIDRGGELFNDKVRAYFKSKTGKEPRCSNTERPWENGLAEKTQDTIWNCARADLKFADLPFVFWGPAVLNAANVLLHRPVKRLQGKSPMHHILGKPPDLSLFRVFGCPVQMLVKPRDRAHKKLGDRSVTGINLGLSGFSKGWKIYVPKTHANKFAAKRLYDVDPTTDMITSTAQFSIKDSQDVIFNEMFRDLRGRQMQIFPRGKKLHFPADHEVQFENGSKPLPAPKRKIKSPKNQPAVPAANEQKPAAAVPPATEPKPPDTEPPPATRQYVRADGIIQQPALSWIEPSQNPFELLAPAPAPGSTPLTGSAGPGHLITPAPQPAPAPAPAPQLPSSAPAPAPDRPLASVEPAVRASSRIPKQKVRFNPGASNEELAQETRDFMASHADSQAFYAANLPEPIVREMCDGDAMIATTLRPDRLHEYDDLRRQRAEQAIDAERDSLLNKCVDEIPIDSVPRDEKIHRAVLNLVEKEEELKDGTRKWERTKARCCFFGSKDQFDASGFPDVFAPCVKWLSVLIIACLIGMFGFSFTGIDYTAAYLNARLSKPMRRRDKNGNLLIWLVYGALYGHPESGKAWHKLLCSEFISCGYSQHKCDPCVFSKWCGLMFCLVLLQTDDALIVSNSKDYMDTCKTELLGLFDGRDLGDVTVFNGVTFKRQSWGLSLHLKHYWGKVFSMAGLQQSPGKRTPISKKVSTADCPPEPIAWIRKIYWKLTGFLVYGATRVRPDLAYAVNSLTRVASNPSEMHLQQLYDSLSYVRSTIDEELKFFRDPSVYIGMNFVFDVWPDSSFADDEATMRSTGGWYIFLRPFQGAISAHSHLRRSVTTSSTESEYCTYCDAAKDAMYVLQFLEELKLFKSVKFQIHCDSQPAIKALKKDVTQSRFKHVRIGFHYLRDLITEGMCWLTKVCTLDHVGDLTTKPLSETMVAKFRKIVLGRGN